MDITRDTVNQWLEENRRGREWLAEKCRVRISAVGNWLNKKGDARPIPAEHQITIRALMEEDAAAARAKPPHSVVLEFSDEQYSSIEHAALSHSETVREWAKRNLNECANQDMERIAASITAHMANDAGLKVADEGNASSPSIGAGGASGLKYPRRQSS